MLSYLQFFKDILQVERVVWNARFFEFLSPAAAVLNGRRHTDIIICLYHRQYNVIFVIVPLLYISAATVCHRGVFVYTYIIGSAEYYYGLYF